MSNATVIPFRNKIMNNMLMVTGGDHGQTGKWQ